MGGALAGLVILVIGDGHMSSRDYLATTLHNLLIANGAEVDTYGMCGTIAADWIYKVTAPCRVERHGANGVTYGNTVSPTWVLGELIEQNHPNLVLIELGDGMAGYDKPKLPKSWIADQVREFVGRIAARDVSCVWVGPTWGNPDSGYHKTVARVREMSDFLSRIVAPCGYVDSTKFAKPGEWATVDGQHFTHSGYRKWAIDIAEAIVEMRDQFHANMTEAAVRK
jgi:hypothetical protein